MSEMTNTLSATLAARLAWPAGPRPAWGFWATSAWGAAAIGVYLGAAILTSLVMMDWRPVIGLEPTAGTILGGALAIAVVLVAIRYTGLPWRDHLALRRPERIDFQFGLVCILFLVGAYAVMDHFLGDRSPMRASSELFRSLQVHGMLVPFALAGVVVAPVAEELVFRGFLYRGWSPGLLGVAGTILLTSLLWSVLHMKPTPGESLPILCVGLLLGTVRWLSGSTSLTIGIHMAHNAVVVAWASTIAAPLV